MQAELNALVAEVKDMRTIENRVLYVDLAVFGKRFLQPTRITKSILRSSAKVKNVGCNTSKLPLLSTYRHARALRR